MKASATPIIRAFGFRPVLMANAAICPLFMMSYGMFRPTTPHWRFSGAVGGRVFPLASGHRTNTLVFADVPPALMSRATSFASMAQQLSMGLGIGTSAMLLQLMQWCVHRRGAADQLRPISCRCFSSIG